MLGIDEDGFELGARWVNNHTGDVARMVGANTVCVGNRGVRVFRLEYEDGSIYKEKAVKYKYDFINNYDEESLRKHFTHLPPLAEHLASILPDSEE